MPRMKKDGQFLNVRVSDELFKKVEEYSKTSLLPKTAIVELALKEYLSEAEHGYKFLDDSINNR